MAEKTDANAEQLVAEANRTYFVVLGITRGSLGRLAMMAILVITLLGVVNVGPWRPVFGLKGYGVVSTVFNANLVIITGCGGVLILSLFTRLTYRFQVFFSAVMAVLAVGLVYSICLLALTFAAFVKSNAGLSVQLFSVLGIFTVVLLIGATFVHVLLLRRRMRVGHSESRTIGNFVAVSRSNKSTIYWVTLGVVLLVPNVMTLGRYWPNTIGVVMLVFLVCVTPSLPVEFAYLAYLKSKDRVYWQLHWSTKRKSGKGSPRHAVDPVEES